MSDGLALSQDDSTHRASIGIGGHYRVGEIAWISRTDPLPTICVVTGEPAQQRVSCLFHYRETPFNSGSLPLDAIAYGIAYYLKNVPKAILRLPVSDEVVFRRKIGWLLTLLLVLTAIGTCAVLYWGQLAIHELPQGAQRDWLDDWGIPLLAIGGFAVIATLLIVISRIMPMLTVIFKVQAITPTHVALSGLDPRFIASLPNLDINAADNSTAISKPRN